MKSITVVSEDKVGLLAEISHVLAKKQINIEHMDFEVVGKKAIVALTVTNTEGAKDALNASGFKVAQENCIVIRLNDKPGEFNRIAGMLAHEGIGIERVHMLSREGKRALLQLVVDKPEPATRILHDYLSTSNPI